MPDTRYQLLLTFVRHGVRLLHLCLLCRLVIQRSAASPRLRQVRVWGRAARQAGTLGAIRVLELGRLVDVGEVGRAH